MIMFEFFFFFHVDDSVKNVNPSSEKLSDALYATFEGVSLSGRVLQPRLRSAVNKALELNLDQLIFFPMPESPYQLKRLALRIFTQKTGKGTFCDFFVGKQIVCWRKGRYVFQVKIAREIRICDQKSCQM